MAHLYLPADHNETDLVLAAQIAELVYSAELYVVWTSEQGRAVPAIAAELRAPAPRRSSAVARLVAALRELWAAIVIEPPRKRPAPKRAPAPKRQTAP